MTFRNIKPSKSTAAGLLAVGGLIAGGLALNPATASTPSSGTVSDSQTSQSWSGGPFVVPNVTAQAGDQPICDTSEACDDFSLHVSTPAGYGADHNLQIKVGWPTAAADFDVYLLDQQGNVVSTAASSADPETVIVPPDTATYTVRVVPFAPLGQSYSATANLVTKPIAPPPSGATPPSFRNYAAPSSLNDANNAGEPSIGNDFNTDSTFYQSYLSTYKVKFNDAVTPATAAWTDVSANANNGCAVGSTTSLDPILFTDHETGRTFESQLSGVNSLTCYTDDGGQTWLPSTGGGIPSGVDHQTIGGGNFSPNGPGGLGLYDNAVYYCSQDIATAFCAISRDEGTTFGPGVPAYSLLDCGGLHGHVKVAPDGTAYLPNKGCGSTQALVVSKDNGTTWAVNHVPGSTPGDSDPSVGVGSNGSVYFGYVGADGVPGVSTSHDQGATWTDNQPVGGEFAIKNAVFQTGDAGDDDRAAFAYLGTPTGGNYQDPNFQGVWHLYVSYTYDGGKTWATSDATPTDPVQRGSICTAGTTCGSDRNLLDFIDVTIDNHGRVEVGYADGCIAACVTGGTNNHDAYATIARQSSGQSLFAAFDPAANLKFSSASLTTTKSQVSETMRVTNSGGAVAKGVRVKVTDGSRFITTTSAVTLQAGQSTTLRVTWKPQGKGQHTVVSVVDPSNLIAESNENDNKVIRKFTVR
ncbi:MAG: CARDB domain-containing protein [Nocardioidaceae bacterium]